VRFNNGSSSLTYTFRDDGQGINNQTVSLLFNDKQYDDIYILLNDINKAIINYNNSNSIYGTITFSYVVETSSIYIYTTYDDLVLNNNFLVNKILGFQSTDVKMGSSLNASKAINLFYDTYLNFIIKNLPLNGSNNFNGSISSFKIPINPQYGSIYYFNEDVNFKQTINIYNDSIINNLDVVILDRYNNDLNNYGNYSFTLNFKN